MAWDGIVSVALQKVLEVFLPLLAVSVTGACFAFARVYWGKAKMWNPTVTTLLEEAAQLAVKAAEQAGAAKLVADKKEYALELATMWLAARGVKLDLGLISGAIEAAVFDEFGKSEQLMLHAEMD